MKKAIWILLVALLFLSGCSAGGAVVDSPSNSPVSEKNLLSYVTDWNPILMPDVTYNNVTVEKRKTNEDEGTDTVWVDIEASNSTDAVEASGIMEFSLYNDDWRLDDMDIEEERFYPLTGPSDEMIQSILSTRFNTYQILNKELNLENGTMLLQYKGYFSNEHFNNIETSAEMYFYYSNMSWYCSYELTEPLDPCPEQLPLSEFEQTENETATANLSDFWLNGEDSNYYCSYFVYTHGNYPYLTRDVTNLLVYYFDPSSMSWQLDSKKEVEKKTDWDVDGQWECEYRYGTFYLSIIDINAYGMLGSYECYYNFVFDNGVLKNEGQFNFNVVDEYCIPLVVNSHIINFSIVLDPYEGVRFSTTLY